MTDALFHIHESSKSYNLNYIDLFTSGVLHDQSRFQDGRRETDNGKEGFCVPSAEKIRQYQVFV